MYIATDEKDKNFFNVFRTRWPTIRFMDDYMDIAGLRTINPNFLGMIDQVVCVQVSIYYTYMGYMYYILEAI